MHTPVARFGRLRSASDHAARIVGARPIAASLAALALVSLLFVIAPGIDLAVSRVFYRGATGFSADRDGALQAVRSAGTWIERGVALAALAPLAVKLWLPERRLPIKPRFSLFMLASLALGPGLIVNMILKDHWGRARPRQILDFGGSANLTPVWQMSHSCHRNCSFVSGEASSAFWLVALVFIAPPQWRPMIAAVTLSIAALVSITRIASGGHFLSDVLIAWLLTLLAILVTWRVVLQGPPASFDAAAEAWLGRLGLAVRRLGRKSA